MGAPAVRVGDILNGHPCWGAHSPTSGSPNVIINGKPSVRLGDPISPHGCPGSPPHGSTEATGSSTVFVNGKPKVRVGDVSACGSTNAVGSPNVITG